MGRAKRGGRRGRERRLHRAHRSPGRGPDRERDAPQSSCRPLRGDAMNRSMRTLVAATLAACILPAAAFGQTASGGAPGSWLSEYAGARTVGLGGAFVATADDALGVLWNPAGLQWMDQNQAMFESVRLFENTSINSLSFAIPGSRLPSLGVSMVALSSGQFQRTDELNNPLGTFSEGETA